MNALASLETAMNVLAGSATVMNTFVNSETIMNVLAGSTTAMNVLVGSTTAMSKIVTSSVARNALYNNAAITESRLGDSTIAIQAFRTSTQTVQVTGVLNTAWQTLYAGKAFVIEIWEDNTGTYTRTCGDYVLSPPNVTQTTSTTKKKVNRFASQVSHVWSSSQRYGSSLIFKI